MSIILFLVVLAILILSHEFGHFIVAKKAGLRVDEFGFGFPPKLWSVKKGETVYSINALPLGGFVKIYGEDSEARSDRKSFGSQPMYVRAMIIAAGVVFNLLLAWPFIVSGYLLGAPVSMDNSDISGGKLTEKGVMILQVQEGTPAQKAGLKEGDILLKISSKKDNSFLDVSDVKAVQNFILERAGSEIEINYLRGDEKVFIKAVPLPKPEAGKGSLGIVMDRIGIIKLPFHRALWEGLKTTWNLIVFTTRAFVEFFVNIFTEKETLAEVMGPVGIVNVVNRAAQSGFVYVLQLIALLSINLALINLFPFPALDGGRLFFILIELIKGRPISQKTANIAHNIGFAILILLMIAVTYKDISNIFQ